MNKEGTCTSSDDPSKLDRKTIERNRRIQMNALCHKLYSLIPSKYFKPSKGMVAQQDVLDVAARYIKLLTERIEKLKKQEEQTRSKRKMFHIDTKLPLLQLRDLGFGIEVMLVSGLNKTFMLYEVISVLEQEGAEVVTASYSTVNDKIFYTVHAQVKISRVGVETSRAYQRLQDLIAPLESWEYM